MLQLRNIRKTYTTGDFTQVALNGVSLDLRDNEFVAILGPSGSGKTTLLNIVGGLDRYEDGDLIINGTSTKKYRDRDWDAYRQSHDRVCVPKLQPDPAPECAGKCGTGADDQRGFQAGAPPSRKGSAGKGGAGGAYP